MKDQATQGEGKKECWLCHEPILAGHETTNARDDKGNRVTIHERCWEDLQEYTADLATNPFQDCDGDLDSYQEFCDEDLGNK